MLKLSDNEIIAPELSASLAKGSEFFPEGRCYPILGEVEKETTVKVGL